jgi:hypothetical protein
MYYCYTCKVCGQRHPHRSDIDHYVTTARTFRLPLPGSIECPNTPGKSAEYSYPADFVEVTEADWRRLADSRADSN